MSLQPFEWKDRPALIEHLFPVQKVSVESFKEQMAVHGKTLTTLGSYWKGRKPLILNKACILGCLLPTTNNRLKDLEIFEMLMGMDVKSLHKRIEATLPVSKRHEVHDWLTQSYNKQVKQAKRPEELSENLFDHIWPNINKHLGTSAQSFPELIEQMGIARFGHRPKVADVFCGSGQIPFEAARLGCDVYASDLNPISCMLTWGGLNIVGATQSMRAEIDKHQQVLDLKVQTEIDTLGIEEDGKGWRAKVFLYCVEVRCPESGWMVPLLPTLIVSKSYKIIAELIPDPVNKCFFINITKAKNDQELSDSETGTILRDGSKYGEAFLGYQLNGVNYKTKISSIRNEVTDKNGIVSSQIRHWNIDDYKPKPMDVFQERLYCIQWMKRKSGKKAFEYEFRSVNDDDLMREEKVNEYIERNIHKWQLNGWIPSLKIEVGGPPRYQGLDLIRSRGWTYWNHVFNARQLLIAGLVNQSNVASMKPGLTQLINANSRLSRWNHGGGGGGIVAGTFDNQALNTLFNYGCRGSSYSLDIFKRNFKSYPIDKKLTISLENKQAEKTITVSDIYITDPPYGDAVKYEEITEFFIAWLRKNPPPEFANWTWDSRRALAIKGEDEDFRKGMIAAYRNMAAHMPDNGIQVLMFTHQSGTIWADMANIIWASGLQVTAAWYVVTETDSALRQGANVTGTVLLILRKRHQRLETFRDDLGWEIEAAVKEQVESLVGLDKSVREQGSEGLYNDADLQMAGYAAALKVLTAYSVIDGKDMVIEAEAPRQTGSKTFVEQLIEFAVQTAVQFLVPVGFEKEEWQKLSAVERFYLKMLEMEQQGLKTLDNYQNFARAFKVHHFDQLMSDKSKANAARLKLSSEFKGAMMSGDSELANTPLRALLYAMYELTKEIEIDDVLLHLMENCQNYLPNRTVLIKMAAYIADKREGLKSNKTFKPEADASAARVLTEAIKNQRI